MAKVLLVEDEPQLAKKLVDWLKLQNHVVENVSSGEDALQLLSSFSFDLVILDWNLDDITGLEVCTRFRASGGTTPVIFLTGESDIDHKEAGLESGADDYLVKPFEVRELAARMKSIMRRSSDLLPEIITVCGVTFDPTNRTISKDNQSQNLSPKESACFEYLVRHPNRSFSSKFMLDAVWTSDAEVGEDAVRTCFKTMRQKLIKIGAPDVIKTVPHAGYKVET